MARAGAQDGPHPDRADGRRVRSHGASESVSQGAGEAPASKRRFELEEAEEAGPKKKRAKVADLMDALARSRATVEKPRRAGEAAGGLIVL
jgi:hypothetical protein